MNFNVTRSWWSNVNRIRKKRVQRMETNIYNTYIAQQSIRMSATACFLPHALLWLRQNRIAFYFFLCHLRFFAIYFIVHYLFWHILFTLSTALGWPLWRVCKVLCVYICSNMLKLCGMCRAVEFSQTWNDQCWCVRVFFAIFCNTFTSGRVVYDATIAHSHSIVCVSVLILMHWWR